MPATLGFKPEQYNDFEWSLLEALGFTDEKLKQPIFIYAEP